MENVTFNEVIIFILAELRLALAIFIFSENYFLAGSVTS